MLCASVYVFLYFQRKENKGNKNPIAFAFLFSDCWPLILLTSKSHNGHIHVTCVCVYKKRKEEKLKPTYT